MEFNLTKKQTEILLLLSRCPTPISVFECDILKEHVHTADFDYLIEKGYILNDVLYEYSLSQLGKCYIEQFLERKADKKTSRILAIISVISTVATALFALLQIIFSIC